MDTFLGYPCRASNLGGKWRINLIVDERWLVLAYRADSETGILRVQIYKVHVPKGKPDEWEASNGPLSVQVMDELAAFNWIRKQLEELDGRRT